LINIGEPKLEGNRLSNKIDVPDNFKHHLNESEFFASYDVNIDADESILNIPAVCSMLPLAWYNGLDIHVGSIDGTFLKSMKVLHRKYCEVYPDLLFETNILVDNVVKNVVEGDGVALTFSGGIDSMYSLSRLHDLKPRLVTLFRFTHRSQHRGFFDKIVGHYKERFETEMNVVDTNMRELTKEGNYTYLAIRQTPHQIGALAPMSIGRFNRVFTAGGGVPIYSGLAVDERIRVPDIEDNFAWADLSVRVHGFFYRHEKFPSIIEFMDGFDGLKIQTCWFPSLFGGARIEFDFNCGNCPKCASGIIGLLIRGRNPNHYGFDVDDSTWDKLKNGFNVWGHFRRYIVPMQLFIRENGMPEGDYHGSRAFLEWFKEAKI